MATMVGFPGALSTASNPLGLEQKIDLPSERPEGAALYSFGTDYHERAHIGPNQKLTKAIGLWGNRFLEKKQLETDIQSKKTLMAPLLNGQDIQAQLLFPLEEGRPRVVPVGLMLNIGLSKP